MLNHFVMFYILNKINYYNLCNLDEFDYRELILKHKLAYLNPFKIENVWLIIRQSAAIRPLDHILVRIVRFRSVYELSTLYTTLLRIWMELIGDKYINFNEYKQMNVDRTCHTCTQSSYVRLHSGVVVFYYYSSSIAKVVVISYLLLNDKSICHSRSSFHFNNLCVHIIIFLF
jgi:hypothetical protein